MSGISRCEGPLGAGFEWRLGRRVSKSIFNGVSQQKPNMRFCIFGFLEEGNCGDIGASFLAQLFPGGWRLCEYHCLSGACSNHPQSLLFSLVCRAVNLRSHQMAPASIPGDWTLQRAFESKLHETGNPDAAMTL